MRFNACPARPIYISARIDFSRQNLTYTTVHKKNIFTICKDYGNIYFFRHLKLEIALAIPASNE